MLALGVVALLVAVTVALAATGSLKQPSGSAGCISETGAGPCADGHGLKGANSVSVSSDGKSVYGAAHNSVVRLKRKTTAGAVTEPAGSAGCVSDTGAGPCADGHALADLFGLAVSRDGKSVYAAAQGTDSVVRFKRNASTG